MTGGKKGLNELNGRKTVDFRTKGGERANGDSLSKAESFQSRRMKARRCSKEEASDSGDSPRRRLGPGHGRSQQKKNKSL